MVMEAVYPPLQPEDCSRINDGVAMATLEAATAAMEGIRNWFTVRGLLGRGSLRGAAAGTGVRIKWICQFGEGPISLSDHR